MCCKREQQLRLQRDVDAHSLIAASIISNKLLLCSAVVVFLSLNKGQIQTIRSGKYLITAETSGSQAKSSFFQSDKVAPCDRSNRQIAAQPKFLSGIASNQTNVVLGMTEDGSPVTQGGIWKLNCKVVKVACWGSRFLLPHLPCQANWNLLCKELSARGLGPLKWVPEVPHGRKMSRRHRKGKQCTADPSAKLSVRRALGQRQS